MEELMEVTITLTDKEIKFLQRIITELNNYQKNKPPLKMLFMSVYEWLLTKNQRRKPS